MIRYKMSRKNLQKVQRFYYIGIFTEASVVQMINDLNQML